MRRAALATLVLVLGVPLAIAGCAVFSVQRSIDEINNRAEEIANWPKTSDRAITSLPHGASRAAVLARLGEPYPMREFHGRSAAVRGCVYYRSEQRGWRLWRLCFARGRLESKTLE